MKTQIKLGIVVLAMLTGTAFAGGSKCSTCKNSNGSKANVSVKTQSESYAVGLESNAIVFEAAEVPTETTQNVHYSGSTSQTIKNVPNVNAPPLVSSNDTCMGSTSGGLGVAGFGFSLGSSWTDKNCKMLKNSRELWNMGMRGAAMARMCMDDENKEALELTGFVCPQTEKAKKDVQ